MTLILLLISLPIAINANKISTLADILQQKDISNHKELIVYGIPIRDVIPYTKLYNPILSSFENKTPSISNKFHISKQKSRLSTNGHVQAIKVEFKPLPFIYSTTKLSPLFGHQPFKPIQKRPSEELYKPQNFDFILPKLKDPKPVSSITQKESDKFVNFALKFYKSESNKICSPKLPINNVAKVQKYFEQALAIYPDNVNALKNFGHFLKSSNRLFDADSMYYRALILNPNDESTKFCRNKLILQLMKIHNKKFSNLDKTVAKLHQILQVSPPNDKSLNKNSIITDMFFLQIYHTVAIEGNSLNLNEVKSIIQTGRTPITNFEKNSENEKSSYTIRELNEIVGAADAFQYANWTVYRSLEKLMKDTDYDFNNKGKENDYEYTPRILNLDLVKDLHKRLIVRVDHTIAGVYRTGPIYVGGYKAPDAEHFTRLMVEFGYWLEMMEEKVFGMSDARSNSEGSGSGSNEHATKSILKDEESIFKDDKNDRQKAKNYIHPIQFAAEAHYRLVKIHPFQDGNGRLSRLLMNLILMRAGYPPTLIRVEDRQEYFKSLNYDTSFLNFIVQATTETIHLYMKDFGLELPLIESDKQIKLKSDPIFIPQAKKPKRKKPRKENKNCEKGTNFESILSLEGEQNHKEFTKALIDLHNTKPALIEKLKEQKSSLINIDEL